MSRSSKKGPFVDERLYRRVEKLNQMCSQFDAATLEAFRGVKRAFDPQGLLNPGKVFPTLHRCAELGRVHVHGGKLAFPDLPRF